MSKLNMNRQRNRKQVITTKNVQNKPQMQRDFKKQQAARLHQLRKK